MTAGELIDKLHEYNSDTKVVDVNSEPIEKVLPVCYNDVNLIQIK